MVKTRDPAQGIVMVVEDDRDLREMIRHALELQGHQVVEAADGREALDKLRQGTIPGLILLDLMMPGMDGWSFRAAQTSDPALATVPVVLISAHGQLDQHAAALQADGFFRKPVNISSLLNTVDRYVGGWEQDATPTPLT